MLTSKEIRSTTFVTVRKGYAIEDVDAFLNKVAGELDALQNECAAMLKEKDDALEVKELGVHRPVDVHRLVWCRLFHWSEPRQNQGDGRVHKSTYRRSISRYAEG